MIMIDYCSVDEMEIGVYEGQLMTTNDIVIVDLTTGEWPKDELGRDLMVYSCDAKHGRILHYPMNEHGCVLLNKTGDALRLEPVYGAYKIEVIDRGSATD